jgi:hypothetical protein
MLNESLNQSQRKLHSNEARIEAAQEWNRKNNNRWSIKFSADKFQAQMLIDTDHSDFNFPRSITPRNEPQGPLFDTIEKVKMFITEEIEREIDVHWAAKMIFDFDIC